MPYIKLLAPRGEYQIGTLLRILGPGEERVRGAVDRGLASYIVEELGQANYVSDEEAPAPATAPSAPASKSEPAEKAVPEPMTATARSRKRGK